jgi:hypothetical protein
MNYEVLFQKYKVSELFGRYITLENIEPILRKWNTSDQLQIVGKSVLNQPIYTYIVGIGKTKILLWSQMHGNESTTTKALFDFLNFLQSNDPEANALLENFTFCCLPMVNPDGSQLYTRENANKVDLNRDAQSLTQPESVVLRTCFDNFKPDFCYNLHDQRTIFGAGTSGKPATVSFLAPSYNEAREVNEVRQKAINVIVAMNRVLQQYIPNQVGRFDDSFNLNCIGDTFQHKNVPTILFEAGHFPKDYEREETRKFIFISLLTSFFAINENDIVNNNFAEYLNIPQNNVVFFDFVYKNIKINYDNNELITNFAIQFKEELVGNQVFFNAYIVQIGVLENSFGHFEYDARGAQYFDDFENIPKINQKADFYLDTLKIENGSIIKI